MQLRVLFTTTFNDEATLLREALTQEHFTPIECHSGKELLKQVLEKGAFAVIINIDTRSDFSLEIIKQITLYNQHIRVILTFKDVKRYEFYKAAIKNFYEIGIADYFIYPYKSHKIIASIKGKTISEDFKKRAKLYQKGSTLELEKNSLFKMKIQNLLSGNLSPFTIYEEKEDDKFIVFMRKGHSVPLKQFINIADIKDKNFFYTESDRQNYINTIHQLIQKIEIINAQVAQFKSHVFFDIDYYSEKFIKEGIKRGIAKTASSVLSNVIKLIQADEQLNNDLNNYLALSEKNIHHIMLTTFLSLTIVQNIKSCRGKIHSDNIAIASILHEIGMTKLPKHLKKLRPYEIVINGREYYFEHINYSVAKLTHSPIISEFIRQIIYQHCECCDGSGFPGHLLSGNIYQTAKILSLANAYADFLDEHQLQIFDGLETFLFNERITNKFDPKMITALLKGLYRPRYEERQQEFL